MTLDLRAARELVEKATSGPWRIQRWKGSQVAGLVSKHPEPAGTLVCETQGDDADFIAASRTLVPQLLALVEELQASVEAWTGHTERAESARDRSEAENAPLRMALLEANKLVEELQRARDEACDLAIRYSTFTKRDERDELEAEVAQLRAIGQRAEGGGK